MIPSYDGWAADISNNISRAYSQLFDSVEHISSGQRINSASDDAAGMAISDSMRAQTAAAWQSYRNTVDGTSVVQTADGAMSAVSENLTRMKSLAQQASNGTYTDQQRRMIQREFDQLNAQNQQILSTTSFNGVSLFVEGQNIGISVGDGERIEIEGQNVGTVQVDVSDAQAAQAAIDQTIEQVAAYRGTLGATANRLQSAGQVELQRIESISQARSRIIDADLAMEVAALTGNLIMASNGINVFAESNELSESALRLLL